MGLSLRPLGRRLVDIFSADTQADQQRRLAANQPQFYADQQRLAGNIHPATNVGSAFLGNTARFVNTTKAGVGGLYGLGKVGASSVFGNDQSYLNTLRGVNQTMRRDLSPNAGLFGAGTLFDSPEQAAQTNPTMIIKKIGAGSAGVAGEVLPVGRGASVAKQGVRVVPRLMGEGAVINAVGTAGDEYIRTGKITPKNVGLGAVAGAVLAPAPTVAYAGDKKVADKLGVNIVAPPISAPSATPNTKPKATLKKDLPVVNGVKQETMGIRNQIARDIVDQDALLLKQAANLDKVAGTNYRDKVYYATGKVRRSNAAANEEFRSNPNIQTALGGLGRDVKNFDVYANARTELNDAALGKPTSRPQAELQAIVKAGDKQYGRRFEALNSYYGDRAKALRDAGIISEDTYKTWTGNKEYVRLQRNVEDLMRREFGVSGNYNFGSTMTKQKRKGSSRDTLPASQVAAEYTQQTEREIAKNQAASTIIDMLHQSGLANRISTSSTTNRNVISRFVNGKKEAWEIPPDFKRTIDNLDSYQLGVLARIVGFPARVARAGLTSLNPVFTTTNYLRDQAGSAIFSKNVIATHNPANILRGLWAGAKDFAQIDNDPLFKEFVKVTGNTTQYDLTRNAAKTKAAVRQVTYGQTGKLANRIIHPIRTLEDLNSITEKATRFQNFQGVYNQAIKKGMSHNDALMEATLAAWRNSVDFGRAGRITRVINLMVPYFNPGVQGSRTLARNLKERPFETSAKTITGIGVPLAAVTMWNLSNDDTKQVYQNLPDYEKENNIIMVLPNTKQNEDGSYNVIKLPMPPGISALVQPIRRSLEAYESQNPAGLKAIAQDVIQPFTGTLSIQSKDQFISSVLPQAIKPAVQQAANKDYFTGKNIVPDYLKTEQPQDQVYKSTSGSMRALGATLNKSPLQVEKYLKDTFGKLADFGINAVDTNLAKQGKIPQEQVGGQSLSEAFARRFTKAFGVVNYNRSEGAKFYEDVNNVVKGIKNKDDKKAFELLHEKNTQPGILDSAEKAQIYLSRPEVFKADKKLDQLGRARGKPGNPIYNLNDEQLNKVLIYRQAKMLNAGKQTYDKNGNPLFTSLGLDEKWYDNFRKAEDAFYQALPKKEGAKSAPDTFSGATRPQKTDQITKLEDAYYALPSGTGDRTRFLRANPALLAWWEASDGFTNAERTAIGLKVYENSSQNSGSSGGRYYAYRRGGSGNNKQTAGSDYKYAVSLNAGGATVKPKVTAKQAGETQKAKGKTIAKPKVTLKKSMV